MINSLKKSFKGNKNYLLIGLGLILINVFLFWLNKTQVAQEFFYYPWMISKGNTIYKDFFYNHGPLLYYLFIPFSFDKSFTLFKIFNVLVQCANLLLVLLIVKKSYGVRGFIISGLTFLILNFYFSYNYFWDEQIIATFYLLIYYLVSIKKFPLKSAFIGILIGFASLIKPNALIISIPILFFSRNKSFLFYPILIWFFAILYFFLQNALPQFIDNFIFFNSHYQNTAVKVFPYLSAIKAEWLFISLLMTIFIFAIHALNRKNFNWKLIFFLLVSALCMYPIIGDDRFSPFTSFLAIFIAYLFSITKKKLYFFIILCLFLLSFSYLAKNKVDRLRLQETSIASTTANVDFKSQKIINYLKNNKLTSKNFYVLSNNVEIYYLLDKPYNVYFPVMFPVVSSYYKNFQETYIADIRRNKTDLIIVPTPVSPSYGDVSNLISFIKENYTLYYQDKDFLVYVLKSEEVIY